MALLGGRLADGQRIPHEILFTGGLPAPQNPWQVACSPPRPLAQFLRGSASQALCYFLFQDLGTRMLFARSGYFFSGDLWVFKNGTGAGWPHACHAMSWLHVPCHILACRVMPYFGVSWRAINIPCHAAPGFFFQENAI